MAPLTAESPLALSLYRPLEAAPGVLRFKLFHRGAPVPLSDGLPMLERMGLKVMDERPHRIAPVDAPPVWMHDFGMLSAVADAEVEIDALHSVFEDAFARIFRGEVENDDSIGSSSRHACPRRNASCFALCEIHAPDRIPLSRHSSSHAGGAPMSHGC
jgi:NAD-specific glutamate dehydrogenase